MQTPRSVIGSSAGRRDGSYAGHQQWTVRDCPAPVSLIDNTYGSKRLRPTVPAPQGHRALGGSRPALSRRQADPSPWGRDAPPCAAGALGANPFWGEDDYPPAS